MLRRRQQFSRRNTFFFYGTFSGKHRYRAKPAPSERNHARRVITRKYGRSRPAADPSRVIDGKAKPLNAPNYLVNRAKCARARAQRMTNERPVGYRRFRWDQVAIPRCPLSPKGESRYKLIRRRYALISWWWNERALRLLKLRGRRLSEHN